MHTTFRIDKGVPIPPRQNVGVGNKGSQFDFLLELEVNDSTFLKTSTSKTKIKSGMYFRTTSLASYIHRMSKLVNMKWVYRTRAENNVLGARVWRIS